MKQFVAHCTVLDGKLVWKNDQYLAVNLPKFEGKQGVLTIKQTWNKRSLNQNRYFWLCLGIISEHTGHTPEELHVVYKGLYCPKKEVKLDKKRYMIPKGTSELTKGQFVEFMLNIQAEAASLGIALPDPSEFLMGLDTPNLLD